MATEDFNGDGFDDLAVEFRAGDINDLVYAAVVNVFAGSASDITSESNQVWFQDQPGAKGLSEKFNLFGDSLSMGDFNGNGFDDLAIGVTEENIGNIVDAGAANVLFDSADGLTA